MKALMRNGCLECHKLKDSARVTLTNKLIFFVMSITTSIFSIMLISLLCLFAFSTQISLLTVEAESANNRPIIGVLSQEISYYLNKKYPGQSDSYIAASYVKFVEGAGARVVPIRIGQNESYYRDILNKINGVLWPGGGTFFNQSEGYAEAGNKIYRIAKEMNENGDYLPILGICLGMELLTYVEANQIEHRIECNSQNQPLPLEFKPRYRESKMFKNAPANIIKILTERNVTANYHHFCVTEEGLAKVTKELQVLALNHDKNGVQFISALEHTRLPFYGVQFHPEKNIYEWVPGKNIPHGLRATRAAQYFAEFFVNEARKNHHKFPSVDEEASSLIYNYPVTYTGLQKSAFLQCYMFKKNDTL